MQVQHTETNDMLLEAYKNTTGLRGKSVQHQWYSH